MIVSNASPFIGLRQCRTAIVLRAANRAFRAEHQTDLELKFRDGVSLRPGVGGRGDCYRSYTTLKDTIPPATLVRLM